MAKLGVYKPRNGCALHGAVSTIEEIRGAIPIVHSNQGCAVQNYLANKTSGAGASIVEGFSLPGTTVQERHVIFGGASRLREQIKNTVKVINGDLYVVLNSCESAMVGDDIDAMTKESFEQGEPILDSILAGFNGDNHVGYAQVLTDIFKKLPDIWNNIERPEGEEKTVNILGILPKHDIFYKGELRELRRILSKVGIKANIFFGSRDGVQELKTAVKADLTLNFSKWGVQPAEVLKEKYGIPYITFEAVPTGVTGVRDFLDKTLDALGLERSDKYEQLLAEAEEEYSYYLARLEEDFYSYHLNRRIGIVGDERTVVQISKFLSEYLQIIPALVIVTDFYSDEEHTKDTERERLSGISDDIHFRQDANEISSILEHSDIDIILGSSLEEKEDIPNLIVSYPAYNREIISKSYAGLTGGLTLLEDIVTLLKSYDSEILDRRFEEKINNSIRSRKVG